MSDSVPVYQFLFFLFRCNHSSLRQLRDNCWCSFVGLNLYSCLWIEDHCASGSVFQVWCWLKPHHLHHQRNSFHIVHCFPDCPYTLSFQRLIEFTPAPNRKDPVRKAAYKHHYQGRSLSIPKNDIHTANNNRISLRSHRSNRTWPKQTIGAAGFQHSP